MATTRTTTPVSCVVRFINTNMHVFFTTSCLKPKQPAEEPVSNWVCWWSCDTSLRSERVRNEDLLEVL